ncbi:MAG: RNA polymerase sigma factor region1.1 domain-containing protein, partial [Pseudomonadota bacterium]
MAAKDTDQGKPDDKDEAAGHMLDMSQAAVKKMIAQAKARGYITYDELNEVMPSDQVGSEQIEDVMAMLSEMGINVIEAEEAEEEQNGAAATDIVESAGTSKSRELATTSASGETLDRTDDPVRMYLREMGSVELLSREGEIAIAKRIEAGRNTMIAGLCESPLTFQAITIWRDELLDEEIMLRDVIDLETTFGAAVDEDEDTPVVGEAEGAARAEPAKPADAAANAGAPDGEERSDETAERDEEDEEEEQANLSLAAMEASLKPKVLETLDRIAEDYATLAAMQDSRMSAALNEDESFTALQERDYQRLRAEIVELVNSLHLHGNRIEALVDQLYGINRKIMSLDGAMVKLADQARITRSDFVNEYRGSELDPGWVDRVATNSGRGWDVLTDRYRPQVEDLRADMAEVGQYVGVDISEFRRIVSQVQK